MAETKPPASRPSLAISDPHELTLIQGWADAAYKQARQNAETSDDDLARMYELRTRVQKALQKAGGVSPAPMAPSIGGGASTGTSAAPDAASKARSTTAK